MISSRHLEYFVAVARELHFTRAAESLRVAQPALSQQIRRLERQLGVTLFERTSHGVELTAAGAALLVRAQPIVAELHRAEQEMAGWADGVRGQVRVGATRGLIPHLAPALKSYGQAFPTVELALHEQETEQLLASLYADRLDAALLAMPPGAGDRLLSWHELGPEPLVLISAPDTQGPAVDTDPADPADPEAPRTRDRVALADLDGRDLICYPEGTAIRAVITAALAAVGAVPRERFASRECVTARVLAHTGLAAAIVPLSAAEGHGPEVRIADLDPQPVWRPTLAWSARRAPGAALRAFLDTVLDQAARKNPCTSCT